MSYRLFKKYNEYSIKELIEFLNLLKYYKNENISYISEEESDNLFMTKQSASLCLLYTKYGYFHNEHYINKIIKSYPEFKDLDSKILTDKNWLVDYIEKNFKYDMNHEDLESFRY